MLALLVAAMAVTGGQAGTRKWLPPWGKSEPSPVNSTNEGWGAWSWSGGSEHSPSDMALEDEDAANLDKLFQDSVRESPATPRLDSMSVMVEITVFGALGKDPQVNSVFDNDDGDDSDAVDRRARKLERTRSWIFEALTRSLFDDKHAMSDEGTGATSSSSTEARRGFDIRGPVSSKVVVFQAGESVAGDGSAAEDERASVLPRTVFRYIFQRETPEVAREIVRRLCGDFHREEFAMIGGILRALDNADNYPYEAWNVFRELGPLGLILDMRSFIHHRASIIDREGEIIEGGGCNDQNDMMDPLVTSGYFVWPDCPPHSRHCSEEGVNCMEWEKVLPNFCKCNFGYSGVITGPSRQTGLVYVGSCTPIKDYCTQKDTNGEIVLSATVGSTSWMACPKGTQPNEPVTCLEVDEFHGSFNVKAKCVLSLPRLPPEPLCTKPSSEQFQSAGQCDECKAGEESCECYVLCQPHFKDRAGATEFRPTCKKERFDCPTRTTWNNGRCTFEGSELVTNRFCCPEPWEEMLPGSFKAPVAPPLELGHVEYCDIIKDALDCVRNETKGEGQPCCWDATRNACLSKKHSRDAPDVACAIRREVFVGAWDRLPKCEKTVQPKLEAMEMAGLDFEKCDNCLPAIEGAHADTCDCHVSCQESRGYMRIGGGFEGPMRFDERGRPARALPVCAKEALPPKCVAQEVADELNEYEFALACSSCRADQECPECFVRCAYGFTDTGEPDWVALGLGRPTRCVSQGYDAVNECREISSREECLVSAMRLPGRTPRCCWLGTECVMLGDISNIHLGSLPEGYVPHKPLAGCAAPRTTWLNLPSCVLISEVPVEPPKERCKFRDEDQVHEDFDHVVKPPICLECNVGELCRGCVLSCSDGNAFLGGILDHSHGCGADGFFDSLPKCVPERRLLPKCHGPSAEHDEDVLPGLLPHAGLRFEGCLSCEAGDQSCCRVSCQPTHTDVAANMREGVSLGALTSPVKVQCVLDDLPRVHYRQTSCTKAHDEASCTESAMLGVGSEEWRPCCWRAETWERPGRCVPIGSPEIGLADEVQCASNRTASFRGLPDCKPFCRNVFTGLPWTQETQDSCSEGCVANDLGTYEALDTLMVYVTPNATSTFNRKIHQFKPGTTFKVTKTLVENGYRELWGEAEFIDNSHEIDMRLRRRLDDLLRDDEAEAGDSGDEDGTNLDADPLGDQPFLGEAIDIVQPIRAQSLLVGEFPRQPVTLLDILQGGRSSNTPFIRHQLLQEVPYPGWPHRRGWVLLVNSYGVYADRVGTKEDSEKCGCKVACDKTKYGAEGPEGFLACRQDYFRNRADWQPHPDCRQVCERPSDDERTRWVIGCTGCKSNLPCHCEVTCRGDTRWDHNSGTQGEKTCVDGTFVDLPKCTPICHEPDVQGGGPYADGCIKKIRCNETCLAEADIGQKIWPRDWYPWMSCNCSMSCRSFEHFKCPTFEKRSSPSEYYCRRKIFNGRAVGMWHSLTMWRNGEAGESPYCVHPYRVLVYDSKTNRLIEEALLHLYDGAVIDPDTWRETVKIENFTRNGRVWRKEWRLQTRYVKHMTLVAEARGYYPDVKNVERGPECWSKFGADLCGTKIHLLKRPRTEARVVVEDDGSCYVESDQPNKFIISASVSWKSRASLDLWGRSWDCGIDVQKRYNCGFGKTIRENLRDRPRSSEDYHPECRRADFEDEGVRSTEASKSCRMKQTNELTSLGSSQDARDQFSKWVTWAAMSADLLDNRLDSKVPIKDETDDDDPANLPVQTLRRKHAGNPNEGVIFFEPADKAAGAGDQSWSAKSLEEQDPETVTFRNVPAGRYQIAVNMADAGPDNLESINQANAFVNIRVGGNAVFRCQIQHCKTGQRIWSVANFVLEEGIEVGGKTRYRLKIKDLRSNMEPLTQSTLPFRPPDKRWMLDPRYWLVAKERVKRLGWRPSNRPYDYPETLLEGADGDPDGPNDEILDRSCHGQCEPVLFHDPDHPDKNLTDIQQEEAEKLYQCIDRQWLAPQDEHRFVHKLPGSLGFQDTVVVGANGWYKPVWSIGFLSEDGAELFKWEIDMVKPGHVRRYYYDGKEPHGTTLPKVMDQYKDMRKMQVIMHIAGNNETHCGLRVDMMHLEKPDERLADLGTTSEEETQAFCDRLIRTRLIKVDGLVRSRVEARRDPASKREQQVKRCSVPCTAIECKDQHGKVRCYSGADRRNFGSYGEVPERCFAKHTENSDTWCWDQQLVGPGLQCCTGASSDGGSVPNSPRSLPYPSSPRAPRSPRNSV